MDVSAQAQQSEREAELLARLLEAHDAVRARDEFIAIAAHELRNPMHALGLQLSALQRLAAAEGQAALAERVDRAVGVLQAFVERANVLLDVSRINSGLHRLVRGPVELGALVRQAVELHRAQAEFVGVPIELVIDEAPLVGHWDAHALSQVVGNLVSNAIKYGGGKPVRIGVACATPGTACVEVRDQGPGIAQEEISRLFGKFEQLVNGRLMGEGYGLGLWIARQLVEAHGGRLAVDSDGRSGTAFRVTLPLPASGDTG